MTRPITAGIVVAALLLGGVPLGEVTAQRRGGIRSNDVRYERPEKSREDARRERLREEESRQTAQDTLLRQLGLDRPAAKARLSIYDRARQFYVAGGLRKGLTAFRAQQASGTHLKASFDDPPLAHLYALFGRSVRDRPDTATALLGPPLRPGLAIFNAVPETKKEFADVFGEKAVPSRSALEAVRAGSLALDRIKGSHFSVITLAQVIKAIGRTRESTVLLVGHNESGVLISPSGNRLPLGEIARSCAKFGKICVFLSCRAAKHIPGAHGPMVDISPSQASRIASKIAAMLEEQPTKSLEALVPPPALAPMIYADPWRLVRNVDAIIADETTGRTRLFYVGLSVGGVIIVALVVVDLDGVCDNKSEDCLT